MMLQIAIKKLTPKLLRMAPFAFNCPPTDRYDTLTKSQEHVSLTMFVVYQMACPSEYGMTVAENCVYVAAKQLWSCSSHVETKCARRTKSTAPTCWFGAWCPLRRHTFAKKSECETHTIPCFGYGFATARCMRHFYMRRACQLGP